MFCLLSACKKLQQKPDVI